MKKELGLYLHIPFCVRKCAYCDFLSFPAEEEVRKRYVNCLIEEIRQFDLAEDYVAATIFFGGGTPSLLEGSEIRRIMNTIRERFSDIREDAEITIECNPGTLTEEKLLIYKEAGINRLSLGLQSADEMELKLLGRIHTYEQFEENFYLARKAGFANINVDLMSALPGQSIENYRKTLQKVCKIAPEHISAYSLIIEQGTPFAERYGQDAAKRETGEKPQYLPSEEEERRMYEDTETILSDYGFHRYEISNYAKEGYACRHNIGYWKRVDYAGFGLGASALQNPLRYKNTEDLQEYLNHDFSKKELLVLTKDNQIEETMFLGLRMTEGISLSKFEKQFGCPLPVVYRREIDRLTEGGMLRIENDRIFLTEKGMDVSNYVLSEFLLD